MFSSDFASDSFALPEVISYGIPLQRLLIKLLLLLLLLHLLVIFGDLDIIAVHLHDLPLCEYIAKNPPALRM